MALLKLYERAAGLYSQKVERIFNGAGTALLIIVISTIGLGAASIPVVRNVIQFALRW